MVAAVVERFGGIDVLVNNAGIEKDVPTLEMPLEVWDAILRTNLTGAFLCLREAGKQMAAARSGVIVNVSSVHELIPWPGFAHYCASKGGMKLLTQTVARELAPLGVRCVNIAPGAVATPINKDVLARLRSPSGRWRRRSRSVGSGSTGRIAGGCGLGGQRRGGVRHRHHRGRGRGDVDLPEFRLRSPAGPAVSPPIPSENAHRASGTVR